MYFVVAGPLTAEKVIAKLKEGHAKALSIAVIFLCCVKTMGNG